MIEQLQTTGRANLQIAELNELTEFACLLADAAGNQILPYFRSGVEVDNKASADADALQSFDPVTVADKAAETAIRELIRQHYPTHGILGEEHGFEPGTAGLTWVLDPIDGTRAFITGLPVWGCLIALYDGQQPVLGIMDQPYLKERYIGSGRSARCIEGSTEVKLQTRQSVSLDEAVLMSTTPDMFITNEEQSAFARLVQCVRMRRYGGDCYAYCMLARGLVDLVVEADLKPYDIMALVPIIENSNGVITNWEGNSASAGGRIIAAGSAELHQQALRVLNDDVA